MNPMRVAAILVLSALLCGCAAKAQVLTEPAAMPALDPPPPPPRVVAQYAPEPEPVAAPAVTDPVVTAKPATRPSRPEQRPDPPAAVQDAEALTRPPAPSLTLTPTPGSEAQTVVAIRSLLLRATRDLSRVNAASLSNDGRAQYESARRFIQQAEDALKTRNVVFAGKLADKAATMAAVLVR